MWPFTFAFVKRWFLRGVVVAVQAIHSLAMIFWLPFRHRKEYVVDKQSWKDHRKFVLQKKNISGLMLDRLKFCLSFVVSHGVNLLDRERRPQGYLGVVIFT